jgi:hypothetical protein
MTDLLCDRLNQIQDGINHLQNAGNGLHRTVSVDVPVLEPSKDFLQVCECARTQLM